MSKVSVLIPARNEPYLSRTVEECLSKAYGDVEVVVTLDGCDADLKPDRRLKVIRKLQPEGMRAAINSAAAVATGDFLFKLDAHCLLSEGYDEALQSECDSDWIVVPRRYRLDVDKWCIREDKPDPVDYHYLSYPYNDKNPGLHGTEWKERARARKDIPLDDEMSSQGSAYFMSRRHWDRLDGLDAAGYGQFIQEFQEIGMKTWLGGGEVKVNKSVFYAHWHKPSRGYSLSKYEALAGTKYSTEYWMGNKWPARKYNLSWLIAKFWPVPTWPEDWAAKWE